MIVFVPVVSGLVILLGSTEAMCRTTLALAVFNWIYLGFVSDQMRRHHR